MQLTDLLGQLGGLQSMARELGMSEQQAASGADALLPAILGGFKRQAQSQPSGLEGLGGLLGGLLGGAGGGMGAGMGPGGGAGQGGGLGDLLGAVLGGGRGGAGGLGAMLDMDGNGNPLDDILRLVGQRR